MLRNNPLLDPSAAKHNVRWRTSLYANPANAPASVQSRKLVREPISQDQFEDAPLSANPSISPASFQGHELVQEQIAPGQFEDAPEEIPLPLPTAPPKKAVGHAPKPLAILRAAAKRTTILTEQSAIPLTTADSSNKLVACTRANCSDLVDLASENEDNVGDEDLPESREFVNRHQAKLAPTGLLGVRPSSCTMEKRPHPLLLPKPNSILHTLSSIRNQALPSGVRPLLRKQSERKSHSSIFQGVSQKGAKWNASIKFKEGAYYDLGDYDVEWYAGAIFAWARLILVNDASQKPQRKANEKVDAPVFKDRQSVMRALSGLRLKDLPPGVQPIMKPNSCGGFSLRSAYAGVVRYQKRWQSSIRFQGLEYDLGTFNSEIDAACIHAWAYRILYGVEKAKEAYVSSDRLRADNRSPSYPPMTPKTKKAARVHKSNLSKKVKSLSRSKKITAKSRKSLPVGSSTEVAPSSFLPQEDALNEHRRQANRGKQGWPTDMNGTIKPFPAVHRDVKTLITSLSDRDILLGRGGHSNNNPGNFWFRRLAEINQSTYEDLPKFSKHNFARSFLSFMRWQGARFLERLQVQGGGTKQQNAFIEAGDAVALDKVSQLLREKKGRRVRHEVEQTGHELSELQESRKRSRSSAEFSFDTPPVRDGGSHTPPATLKPAPLLYKDRVEKSNQIPHQVSEDHLLF
eukprot:CAMPEP_0172456856 /NCGR_PEP_ID=MMETSP1065-20121228/18165_1 /TAXON_ID=265537 /ORGANISM="Amphiprora paludosa, Strain CCMP125" /LENGTH=686 /DNA_ID=CAMNT_0013210149 /DNA_START=20 /DNA_END=2080 /DNA_ORIENTATION=+